jgi:hypothetical protein
MRRCNIFWLANPAAQPTYHRYLLERAFADLSSEVGAPAEQRDSFCICCAINRRAPTPRRGTGRTLAACAAPLLASLSLPRVSPPFSQSQWRSPRACCTSFRRGRTRSVSRFVTSHAWCELSPLCPGYAPSPRCSPVAGTYHPAARAHTRSSTHARAAGSRSRLPLFCLSSASASSPPTLARSAPSRLASTIPTLTSLRVRPMPMCWPASRARWPCLVPFRRSRAVVVALAGASVWPTLSRTRWIPPTKRTSR